MFINVYVNFTNSRSSEKKTLDAFDNCTYINTSCNAYDNRRHLRVVCGFVEISN